MVLITSFAQSVRPIVYFHSRETYFPCTQRELVKACKLMQGDNELISHDILKDHPEEFFKKVDSMFSSSVSHLTPIGQLDQPNTKLVIVDPSIHTNKNSSTKEMQCMFSDPVEMNGQKYVFMTYFLLFGFNGTLESHEFDLEFVTLQAEVDAYTFVANNIELINPRVTKAFLSCHGNGKWFEPSELEHDGPRTVVYSSWESHAMRPSGKRYKRILRFGDDLTDKGVLYDVPVESTVVLANTRSRLFRVFLDSYKAYYFPGRYMDQASPLYRKNIYNVQDYKGYYKFEGGFSDLKKYTKPFQKRLYMLTAILFLLTLTVPWWNLHIKHGWDFWGSLIYRYLIQIISGAVVFLSMFLFII